MNAQTVKTRKIGRYTYVTVNGETVAIMERSPFTGEYCYGLLIDNPRNEVWYRPPFTQTYRRTAQAAANVVVKAVTA